MALVHDTSSPVFSITSLNREQAESLVYDDPETAVFHLLQQSTKLEQQSAELERLNTELAKLKEGGPHAPSSCIPPFRKQTTKAARIGKSKRGAKLGHKGSSRSMPPNIDRREEHTLDHCPDCGGVVTCRGRTSAKRERVIEDIPQGITSEVTEHTINRYWCPCCNKTVEPVVPDALPNCVLGHRVTTFMAWLRFGTGISLSQITDVLNAHLHFEVSASGIVDSSHRIAEILLPLYEQIGEAVKASGALHADETGWRVAGRTHWLWCFCARDATYYMIDRSRGSPALSKFFTEAIDGILVADFWGAYNSVECAGRQRCYPHLFRDVDATDTEDGSEGWRAFRKKLMRLLRDALRLKKADHGSEARASRRGLLDARLEQLIADNEASDNGNVRRYLKRLRRHREELFTFIDYEGVPADNNFAEREIRPAVMLRKRVQGNQSDKGAVTSAVLMSIFRTLRKRGLDPLTEIVNALRHYTLHGTLPQLPCVTAKG